MRRSKNSTPDIHTYIDSRGRKIAEVPLASGKGTAALLHDDWERIVINGGASPHWILNAGARGLGYVKTTCADGSHPTVARLITGAAARQCVSYHDGDRYNLRPENLYIRKGHAKRSSAGALIEPGTFAEPEDDQGDEQ